MRLATLGLLVALCATHANAQDALRLRMSEAMLDAGFDKHLLTRFKFKHRIALAAVGPEAEAELSLLPGGAGVRVFATIGGEPVGLAALSAGAAAEAAVETFEGWLTSTPGKSAIDGFQVDGAALFTTSVEEVIEAKVDEVEGDTAQGAELALLHCGRCHVVDARNRMGGIGSTPSFAALRGRENWNVLFLDYWSHNPHPSFTQITGLTDPFDEERPSHIRSVELTMEEVEAITAFVGTLEPLDLGPPIQ